LQNLLGPSTPFSLHFVWRRRVREAEPPVSCPEMLEAPSLTFGPALARALRTELLLDSHAAAPYTRPRGAVATDEYSER
jgi:hypothetical protein